MIEEMEKATAPAFSSRDISMRGKIIPNNNKAFLKGCTGVSLEVVMLFPDFDRNTLITIFYSRVASAFSYVVLSQKL